MRYKIRKRYQRYRQLLYICLSLTICGVVITTAGTFFSQSGKPEAVSTDRSSLQNAVNLTSTEGDESSEGSEDAANADWKLILVNENHPVPADYEVDLVEMGNDQTVDKRIYDALQAMLQAAFEDGLEILVASSYRTQRIQTELYNAEVQRCIERGSSRKEAKVLAATAVAYPGASEHQLGIAVDLVGISYQVLDEAQAETPEQQWLMKHCAVYGFILRYPEDKTDITGIQYEPWHYRYVGIEAALEITRLGVCLEEYLEE